MRLLLNRDMCVCVYKIQFLPDSIGHLTPNPEYALTKQTKVKDKRNKYGSFVIYGDIFWEETALRTRKRSSSKTFKINNNLGLT